MSDLSATQIEQLFAAMEQNPKLQSRMNALLAIKQEEQKAPAPQSFSGPTTSATVTTSSPQDLNSGKTKAETTTSADLDGTAPAPVETASDLISMVKDVHLPRHIIHADNAFLPDLTAFFTMLHHMDSYVIDLFKARRACLTLSPIHNRIYFLTAINVQVARCLDYANLLDSNADQQALASLLQSYPPEKWHIPGPLLPILKAICTYKVQNALHRRVSPRFPVGSTGMDSGKDETAARNSTPAFDIAPVTIAILCKQAEALKTIDPAKYLDHALFKAPYIFEYKSSTDQTEYKNDVKIAGFTFAKAYASWSNQTAHVLASPALRYEPELNEELVKNIKSYGRNYQMPEITDDHTYDDLSSFLLIKKKKWLKTFLQPMASYANLFEGSGTLADCSVDGPPAGAYVFNFAPSETAPVKPKYPFDPKAQFDLNGTIFSTQGTPEPIAERLAVVSRIHTRPATDHPMLGHYVATTRRFGTVWNQMPVYGPSSTDYFYDSIEEAIPKFVKAHLTK